MITLQLTETQVDALSSLVAGDLNRAKDRLTKNLQFLMKRQEHYASHPMSWSSTRARSAGSTAP